jgi:hypothetical protein
VKKDRAQLTPLPTLRPPVRRVLRTPAFHRPTVLPNIGGTNFSIFHGITLALITLWLLVLTWMLQALHG